MAEKQEKSNKKDAKQHGVSKKELRDSKEAKAAPKEDLGVALLRIYGYDIPTNKNIYVGLTNIKGISWAISGAICSNLSLPRSKKISELSKDEIAKIESFLPNINIPDYLKNRRFEIETGTSRHLYGTDLEVAKDFDIKRLKKVRSWKGVRHSAHQPVRGQRTRSHFRERKIAAVGQLKKKKVETPQATTGGKK